MRTASRAMSHLIAVAQLAVVLSACICTDALAQARVRPATDIRQEFQSSLTTVPDSASLNVRGAVYAAAYSSIRAGRQTRIDLSATLAIYNTSGEKPLVIEKIEYFNTAGAPVERYLDAPIALRPYATIEIFIAADDNRGGAGANFVVGWASNGPIAEPLIETVMIGITGNTSYSFVSQGGAIRQTGESR